MNLIIPANAKQYVFGKTPKKILAEGEVIVMGGGANDGMIKGQKIERNLYYFTTYTNNYILNKDAEAEFVETQTPIAEAYRIWRNKCAERNTNAHFFIYKEQTPENINDFLIEMACWDISLGTFSGRRFNEIISANHWNIELSGAYGHYDPYAISVRGYGEIQLTHMVAYEIKNFQGEKVKATWELQKTLPQKMYSITTCKGMATIEVPNGTLVRRDDFSHSDFILPDGSMLLHKNSGQGRDFRYYYEKSEKKIDFSKLDWKNYFCYGQEADA